MMAVLANWVSRYFSCTLIATPDDASLEYVLCLNLFM